MDQRPRIVVTVADPARQSDPALAAHKNALYAAAIERHGATAVVLDASASDDARGHAVAGMDGLLLSGGADIDPARYGRAADGATGTEPERDALEAAAWAAAARAGLPVLGLCRGLQAINVFSGGTLVQDVTGHAGRPYPDDPPATHPIRLVPGSRLHTLVGGVAQIEVNSYHHQGVRVDDLAPTLVASAWADSPAGDLVEGLESDGGRFIVGVQCHPERTGSTPEAFERLFAAFVEAASAMPAATALSRQRGR
jgi:gamma-glutamyl-gamma-aminobutyrate hydrolase PuuD